MNRMRDAEEKMREEGHDPDSKTQFVIMEGRYYAVMFFVRLPEDPDDDNLRLGGDFNGLVWRHADTPNEWTVQWRFRYYRTRQAWQSGDHKVWYGATVSGPEETVVATFAEVATKLGAATGFPVERLEIQGNSEQFFKVVRRERPSWLHMGIDDEQANKGGNPKGN